MIDGGSMTFCAGATVSTTGSSQRGRLGFGPRRLGAGSAAGSGVGSGVGAAEPDAFRTNSSNRDRNAFMTDTTRR